MDQLNLPHSQPIPDSAVARIAKLPGTYLVIMTVPRLVEITIGALGNHCMNRGYYSYVGSAFGPGGLRSRLSHHVRKRGQGRAHWHIDYLRSIADIVEIWWTMDPRKREHDWAEVFRRHMNMTIPINGFGSSDCSCPAHLFYAKMKPEMKLFTKAIHRHHPDHALIHSVTY